MDHLRKIPSSMEYRTRFYPLNFILLLNWVKNCIKSHTLSPLKWRFTLRTPSFEGCQHVSPLIISRSGSENYFVNILKPVAYLKSSKWLLKKPSYILKKNPSIFRNCFEFFFQFPQNWKIYKRHLLYEKNIWRLLFKSKSI